MGPASRTAPGRRSVALIALFVLAAGRVPILAGDEAVLPIPPRQAERWTAPESGLPRFLVNAASALFEQGLADPRGCEYRGIHLALGNVWGGEARLLFTSGWVLPDVPGAKARYAVAWNGLVYPLADVGGPADLEADVRTIFAASEKDRAARRERIPQFDNNDEASSLSSEAAYPIKVCLLLRIGRADLAEAVWSAFTGIPANRGGNAPVPGVDLKSYGVSYLSLARDLAWYRFNRGVNAHMRGDDELALADARALDALERAVETRAEAMGFDRPVRQVRPGRQAPYMEFLDQLPELLADQERRARDRANPPAPPPGAAGKEDRVAALIGRLDQVAERQWGQPGGVFLGGSPIVKDLIDEGDRAVEPLINVLRSDVRLTRSVQIGRDFHRSRTILRVSDAAYAAITGILKTSIFTASGPRRGRDRPRSREELADEIEAYWNKNQAIPLVERWYRALADDRAGIAAWLGAASNITQPVNVQAMGAGGPFVVTETAPLAPGERPRLRGEPLREGHEPSVAELMVRRIETMLKTPEGQQFELRDPCRMADHLAAWDAVAAAPTLRELTRICRERYARADSGSDWPSQNLAAAIARFTMARDMGGDPGALREYAEWIRTTTPERLGDRVEAVMEPLYRWPEDPSLASAAAWLFGDPRSPWVPLMGRRGSRPSYHVARLIASPLVDVPAFRKLILAALDDASQIGMAEVKEDGLVAVTLNSGLSMGRSLRPNERDAPPAGTKVPIRTCDFHAWQLATLPGAPAFNPAWLEARREAGLDAIAAYVRGRGARR